MYKLTTTPKAVICIADGTCIPLPPAEGEGYKYAHDEADGVAAMECLPERLKGRVYFKPTTRGREKEIGERLARRRHAAFRRFRSDLTDDRM